MIKLDCTRVSVVVICSECAHWSAFAFTKLEGWKSAAAHEERSHPESEQARQALLMHLKRLPDTLKVTL